jgi:two-component system cell cycle sensor histidine kinase/response regulator CckA
MNVPRQTPLTARRMVLVADDEKAIQSIVTRVITELGFVALPVSDGATAIITAAAHRANLACAILDIMMPIVNGIDAAHAIQQLAPDIGIVLMSGAIPRDCADDIAHLRLVGMLNKPFSLKALQELILHAAGGGTYASGNQTPATITHPATG